MAVAAGITGLDAVLRNINREVKQMKRGSAGALRRAALIVKGEALPLTPIDTGNLRAGCFTDVHDSWQGPYAVIGYTAAYAPFVHERTDLKHNPPTQAKFLEQALKNTEDQITAVLRSETSV